MPGSTPAYGGSDGVRDPGQLESALFRAQTGYYPNLIAEAVALWKRRSQNHPFVDGNKRTAFAATYTFLAINGVDITADAESLWQFLSNFYANNTFRFERLDEWLRWNTSQAR